MSSSEKTAAGLEPVEVTQADRELVFDLMRSACTTALERRALRYIKEGRGDDSEAVQKVARHRQSSNAASVGVDAAKAALAKLGWRIENRGGADIRVGEDWCSPATDSDTLMFNALSGIASLSTPTAEPMAVKRDDIINLLVNEAEECRRAEEHFRAALFDEAVYRLSNLHPLGQEYDGDALREAVAGALHKQACGMLPTNAVGPLDDERSFWLSLADAALSASPATTVDETERLREALAFVGHQATCINGHSHYCPNCDRTLHEIGDTVNAALSDRPQAEGEVK